jgi:hypothetical protein
VELSGPNHGILDIIMVNNFEDLKKIKKQIKEKKIFRFSTQINTNPI